MVEINADWHSAFTDESHSSSDEYIHRELSGKYHTLHVLNQTSRMLSSASHALSDGDEAVVILGTLAGAVIGTALGIAEKRRQAAARQAEAPRDDPPQSSPRQQGDAPPDDSSQPAPAQPSAEPLQEPASQQIEQPMEQSM